MIFDTDVLIWALRGNAKAAHAIDNTSTKTISIVTFMELLQGARNNSELRTIKVFINHMQFNILPLSENIGHRASFYVEEHTLSSSLYIADALIAATAIEADLQLLTANDKHFKIIQELAVKRFRP